MNLHKKDENLDQKVVDGFGYEWKTFSYTDGNVADSLDYQFIQYSAPINLSKLTIEQGVPADFGAGSGRWTERILPYFSKIYAVEPSARAIEVLEKKFKDERKVIVLAESIGLNSLSENSLDFAMSLGVLHHIPDTQQALKDISKKIKPEGYFLCYLYYDLENKSLPYKSLFLISSFFRKLISKFPQILKEIVSNIIAVCVYLPFAKISLLIGTLGKDASSIPLHHYADMPFLVMRNDALDRFGTSLEHRFSKAQIRDFLVESNFDIETLKFSDREPFWCFAVQKARLSLD